MKVLYFHQHFSTPQGAAGTRSYEMARALVEKGHSVTMVCGSYQGGKTGLDGQFIGNRRRGVVDGVDVIEINLAYSNKDSFFKRTALFLAFAFDSVRIALSEPCDLIFATTTPLTAGIPGVVARWLAGRRFVFEVRDLWPELPRAMGVIRNPLALAAMSALEWTSYHSAHRLVALSPGIVDGIAARGVPMDRIDLVPNGCDLALFGSEKKYCRPPGVEPGDLLAIYTGTHGIANGLDAVLDAAAVLKKRGRSDIKLALVGDGARKAGLMRHAAEQGLNNVVFLPPIPKLELTKLMTAADVGMQILADIPAFYRGTSPNKFFDYISAGIPVLNNYPGWLADMIEANACGFVVRPGDPEAFANALERAAQDRAALLDMGARAQALAIREFDRKLLAEKFVATLQRALKSSA